MADPGSPRPAGAAHASWLEVSAGALRHNLDELARFVAPAKVGAVLKAEAYGHGLPEVLSAIHGRAEVLFVIAPGDALRIREWERTNARAVRRVLVIGAIAPEEAVALAREGVEAVVADLDWVRAIPMLRAAGVPRLAIHVHVDSGLGREGFTNEAISQAIPMLSEGRDVWRVAGVLTHFANTEDVTEQEYARLQVANFEKGYEALRPAFDPGTTPERHLAASAAALVLPQSRFDVVRAGISLYGLWASPETRISARYVLGEVPSLKPALAWRCVSQVVKWLPAGSFVGYGCTYRCHDATRIAVLPVGYFDGYPRLVSGKAHVLVNGRRCAVLGRVMMNHVVIDVTHATQDESPVTATLLGQDGSDAITAETLAGWAQTIHYEIVARLGPHLRRVVV